MATQEPFWADLQPRTALVERGGSLWLNCSTNCPRPERGGLETSLRRNGTQRGLRWLARQLVDIREPETQPVCFFRCARRTLQARGLIRTYRELHAGGGCLTPRHPRIAPSSGSASWATGCVWRGDFPSQVPPSGSPRPRAPVAECNVATVLH